MYLRELVVVMKRRWYLLLTAVACTVGVGYLTIQAVPPTYTAQAQVLLLPPETSVPKGQNPYLSLGGLTPAGDVLAKALSAPEMVQQIVSQGGSRTYVVELDVNSPAPIVSITADGVSEAESLQTLALVTDELVPTLVRVQRDAQVPEAADIRSTVLTSPTSAERVIKGPLRALIAVGGATLVTLVLLIAAVDALLRRPRRRTATGLDLAEPELEVTEPAPDAEDGDVTGAPGTDPQMKNQGKQPPAADVEQQDAVEATGSSTNGRTTNGRPTNGRTANGRPDDGSPDDGSPDKVKQRSPSRRTG